MKLSPGVELEVSTEQLAWLSSIYDEVNGEIPQCAVKYITIVAGS